MGLGLGLGLESGLGLVGLGLGFGVLGLELGLGLGLELRLWDWGLGLGSCVRLELHSRVRLRVSWVVASSCRMQSISGLMPAFATTPTRRRLLAFSSALTAATAASVWEASVTSKSTASSKPPALIASTSAGLRTVTMAV